MNNDTCSSVTGRPVILKAAERAGIALRDAEVFCDALEAMGYVCVPRKPMDKTPDEVYCWGGGDPNVVDLVFVGMSEQETAQEAAVKHLPASETQGIGS